MSTPNLRVRVTNPNPLGELNAKQNSEIPQSARNDISGWVKRSAPNKNGGDGFASLNPSLYLIKCIGISIFNDSPLKRGDGYRGV